MLADVTLLTTSTGDVCQETGVYLFDGLIDLQDDRQDGRKRRELLLRAGEYVPGDPLTGLQCRWKLCETGQL